MPYRLLHLADLHLDRTFAALGGVPDVARRRRFGLREALSAAGREAARRGCDAVTIGGDLYEHDRAGADTERFLVETFAAWRPIRVFLTPGNHDALMPGSLYRRATWPDNVHLFTESELLPFPLADGLTLWGSAHRDPAWQGNPLGRSAPGTASGGIHLALFHGAELGCRPEGKAVHGPFLAAEIRERGFTLALCGHYHGRRLDLDAGLVYPGSPEPLTFDETGERGPVVVTVGSDGRVDVEPLASNTWTALTVQCDLTAGRLGSDAVEVLAAACAVQLSGLDPGRCLVRVDCSGELDPAVSLDVATVEHVLRERLGIAFVRVVDRTVTALDVEAVAGERSARGAFLRAAHAALAEADEAEAAVLHDALRYGLAALAGAEVGLR